MFEYISKTDRLVLFAYGCITHFGASSQNSLFLCPINWLDFMRSILPPSYCYSNKSRFIQMTPGQ